MRIAIAVSSLLLSALAACGGGPAPAAGPVTANDAPGSAAAAPATFPEQVALGQKLYGEKCAGCHGASGEGGDAPAVVGLSKGALPLDPPATAKHRTTKFTTVADVGAFVMKAMPPAAPGSLSQEEYLAVLAFDLKANGIDLKEEKLDLAKAQSLVIPR